MATPKFNRIGIEFMARINDPTSISAGVILAGSIVNSQAKIEAFVNQALFKLFNDMWEAVNGDERIFLKIFPELGVETAVTTTAGGAYVVDTGIIRDFAKLLDCRISTTYIEVFPPDLLEELNTGRNTELEPSATVPAVIEQARTLYFFPAASFNAQSVYVHYIKMPLSPADGSFLTSGGTYDSPYYDHWNSKIAEIAAQLFFSTTGEI